jgi:hypothetical protein
MVTLTASRLLFGYRSERGGRAPVRAFIQGRRAPRVQSYGLYDLAVLFGPARSFDIPKTPNSKNSKNNNKGKSPIPLYIVVIATIGTNSSAQL